MQKRERERRVIITEGDKLQIINLRFGWRVDMEFSPSGVTPEIVKLTAGEETKADAQFQFTQVTRNLVRAMVDYETTRQRWHGSGQLEIPAELDVHTFGNQFESAVSTLLNLQFSDKTVMSLVEETGKQFGGIETHIGEMPQIVREQVEMLKRIVSKIYNDRAKQADEARRSRHQTPAR